MTHPTNDSPIAPEDRATLRQQTGSKNYQTRIRGSPHELSTPCLAPYAQRQRVKLRSTNYEVAVVGDEDISKNPKDMIFKSSSHLFAKKGLPHNCLSQNGYGIPPVVGTPCLGEKRLSKDQPIMPGLAPKARFVTGSNLFLVRTPLKRSQGKFMEPALPSTQEGTHTLA